MRKTSSKGSLCACIKIFFPVWPLTFRWKWGWDITHVDEIWYPHETEGSLGVVSWKTSSRPPTDVGQIWREQAKLGIGVRSLIFTRDKTLQDAGDNREHVWKGGWGAGYPNISHITEYLMKIDTFWKMEGLGESWGRPTPCPGCPRSDRIVHL